jgi:arylsulfatase A-like enzyme
MTDAASAASNPPPRGVILVMCDTIRRDHLNLYGYERETAPNLARVVREGALFTNTIAQATWTKVSTPSILSGLYPTTHTVEDVPDRLPNSAETLAEIFREAGYATLAFSSVGFSGASTNLHQGFEVMHEAGSRTAEKEGKSAREYVDRLLPWLREHKDSPFFVFLHVFDPHSPFEPRAPFDALWTDAERKAEHEARMEKVRPNIANSRLRGFGMPTREEIEKSDVPVDPFIQQMKDWYDGSIRGMDAEMGRLFEELRALGIDDTTVVAFVGDHGEEFLDHGRTWHGHSVYGELTNVPMLIWRPGLVAAGAAVAETVQTIDLYPTLLDLVGLKTPENVQGRSLRPLIGGAAVAGATWTPRPAVSEKAAGRGDSPNLAHGSIAIVADGWRLIRNTDVEGDLPEIELFNEREDPLNQVDVAEANPEIVEKMKRDLERWQRLAEIAQLKSDEELVGELSAEELKRLRSLGYIK